MMELHSGLDLITIAFLFLNFTMNFVDDMKERKTYFVFVKRLVPVNFLPLTIELGLYYVDVCLDEIVFIRTVGHLTLSVDDLKRCLTAGFGKRGLYKGTV